MVSLEWLELVTHEEAASVADSGQTPASLQEFLEKNLTVAQQVVRHALCLIESGRAVATRTCR